MQHYRNFPAFFVLFCCFSNVFNAYAQPSEGGFHQERLVQKADEKYECGDLYNAFTYYTQALADAPQDVYIIARLAATAYRLRDFEQAQRRYVQLMALDKQKDYPEAQFYYARCLKINNFMNDAQYHFELFSKNYTGKYPALLILAKNELLGIAAAKQSERNDAIKIRHGGDKINTPFSDYNPINAGNNTVYFSALRSDTALEISANKHLEHKNFSKIYSTTLKEGSFTEPQALQGGINQPEEHVGNATISADNNTMFFNRCQLINNVLGHCEIFKTTRLSANEWRAGTAVPTINAPEYSAKQPAIGKWQGKEGLFFVSDAKSSLGGWDIYFAPFSGKEGFDTPQNLGASINTVGNEETPFYDARTETLFFSSDGLPTFGGYDIFKTQTNTDQNKVEQLERGINSLLDDLYFSLDAKGTRAFVVSNRVGSMGLHSQTCCDDIFIIDLPENYFKPLTPLISPVGLTVHVNDARYQPLSDAIVEVFTATGEKSRLRTNENGEVALNGLARGTFLIIKAKKQGFSADSTTLLIATSDKEAVSLLLNTVSVSMPVRPSIPSVIKRPALRKPSTNTAIALHNIYYEYARAELNDNALRTLDSIVQTLQTHPTLVVEIGSHTDSKGNAAANKKLSEQRSYAALEYLVQSGIDAERLIPVGYGAEKPAAPNQINGIDNEGGRALNRRTEFRILEGRALLEE